MNVRERLTSISANLDDLQSGIEAGSRAADGVRRDVASMNGSAGANDDVLKSLSQHATDIETCAAHQQGAMRELRQNVARLGRELDADRDRP